MSEQNATAPVPAKEGRAAIFRALFETELRYVWNTLRFLGVRNEDLEDLGHEVFLTAYQRIDDCDFSRSVRPWLFVIAHHAASNHRRLARHRREVLHEEPTGQDERHGAELVVSARQELLQLQQALEQIEINKRSVLIMHDVDDIAMPEIAEAMSIPLNTAYSRLRLAREELRDMMSKLRQPGVRYE